MPDDLKEHNCIIDSNAPYGDKWPLRTENWPRRFPVKGNIRVNSGSAARDLAVGGAGCTLLPGYLVQDAIDDGRLITMLKDYVVDEGAISMVYPQSRHPSSAVRKFMDMLIEHVEPLKQGRQL